MARTISRNKAEQMLAIVELYLANGGSEPIDLSSLAQFAINNGHWNKGNLRQFQVKLCKREFSQAFREQYHTDAHGRHVRTFHAKTDYNGPGKQQTFWGDIRKADGEYMLTAFQQRRSQIVGDCRQLKTDVDSYNDFNTHSGSYQLPLDFTYDVAEREQPTKYMPGKPKPR
jgi:hypothetical protein